MEERFTNLKNSFIDILQIKETNIDSLQVLTSRIKKIKEHYSDFISANKDTLSIFTLDSFHFQGRLIDIEYEDMNRLFLSITNRMYCDYYKLFKIVIEYIEENINDKKLLELIQINRSQYPVYKDLEPFRQYDLQYIQNLHELLLVILHYLNGFVMKKQHDLQQYQTKNKIGFNIDSFVHSFNYNNIVIKEKLSLFVTFMEFFHNSHMKYLKRFTTKLQLMLSQVNNDIKIENPSTEKDNRKSAIQDLKLANIDRAILHDLKESIGDEDLSVSSENNTMKDSDSPSLTENRSPSPDLSNNFLIEPIIQTNISELTDDNERKSPAKFNRKSDHEFILTGSPAGTPNVTPNDSIDDNNEINSSSIVSNESSQHEGSHEGSNEGSHAGSNAGSQEGSHERSQEGSHAGSQEESQEGSHEGSNDPFLEPPSF